MAHVASDATRWCEPPRDGRGRACAPRRACAMQRAGRMVLRGGAHRCIGALATPRRYSVVAQVRGEIGSPRDRRMSWVGFGRCRAAPRVHRLRLPCCRHQPCQSRALHRRRCSFCTNHSTLPCQMRPMRITTVNVRRSRGRGLGCAGGGVGPPPPTRRRLGRGAGPSKGPARVGGRRSKRP